MHHAWSIDVLTLRGDRVAELTAFIGAEHFEAFGLPLTHALTRPGDRGPIRGLTGPRRPYCRARRRGDRCCTWPSSWALLVVGPWLGARPCGRSAQAERRQSAVSRRCRSSRSCAGCWSSCSRGGCSWRSAAYAIDRSCYEDEPTVVELAPGVTVDEYCDAVLQDDFPGTVVAVSVVVAVVALVWTVTVLVLRARARRRRAPVS